MGLTMAERRSVTRTMAKRYRRVTKTRKSSMLDELCALTGWSRDHARRVLRAEASAPATPAVRAPRPRIYGDEVAEPLRMIWATLNGPSGKRLAPFMAEIIEVLERHGELTLAADVRAKLRTVSAATIDRMLAPDRAKLQIKGRSGTKPGTMLKRQIPIRTFAEWDDARAGFCEVDLVAHDGGNPAGQFCQTLDLTCVATGWTEMPALRNKAQRWCFEALQDIEHTLPFPLLGLDSDNGSEFINDQLYRWCIAKQITFTRSRPQRKNDNCFVEQKNFPVVRQQVGYLRYDTPSELEVLTELYRHLRLYVNFFQPQMRLVEKIRHGAKLTRRHDRARTPYRRILDCPLVKDHVKDALTRSYVELNPVALKLEIARCQDRLLELNLTKQSDPRRGVDHRNHPWTKPFSFREVALQADISREATRRPIRTS
ncbi:MAG: integrase [Actinobacteria bacterium]|nr:integrase [Actinomycetota bacterium]